MNTVQRHVSFSITLCALLLLTACRPIQPLPQSAETSSEASDSTTTVAALNPSELYAAALQDAKVAEPDEIYDGLTAITPDNDSLTWQSDTGRVLMATWTSWNGYDAKVGQDMQLTREVWLTAVPQFQNFCQSYQPTADLPLTLRMEALLGLPPNNGKTRVVTMWVNPADMFRPSPDGEINDTVAELEIPAADHFPSQQAYEFHRDWYNLQLSLDNYDDPSKGYPWTRLGYTYDWGNLESEIGLSEFVVAANSTIAIDKVYSSEEYCTK